MDDHARAYIAPGDMMVVSVGGVGLRPGPNRVTDTMLSRGTVVLLISLPVKVSGTHFCMVLAGDKIGWIAKVFLDEAQ